MKTLLITALLAVGAMGAVCPSSSACPIDNSNGVYFKDEYPNGKHVKYFKCPSGHVFGVVC